MKKICYVVTLPLTIRAFFLPQLHKLAQSYDITVVCTDDGLIGQELGDRIRYIPITIPRGISLSQTVRATRELKKLFVREQFDLVQYSTPNAALCASVAAKQAKIPVRNYHLMGFRFLGSHGLMGQVLKWLEKFSCGKSTHIECVSQSNLELGVQHKIFPRNKAVVVWNGSTGGVDLDRFDFGRRALWRQELRGQFQLKEEDYVCIFAGRITRDKGVNELLSAYGKMKSPCKLFLVGIPETENTIDSVLLESARANSNVYFVGYTEEIEKYFAMSDVLLLPSYREGFGNVIIEAAAVGTPAIVSNIPGPIDAVADEKTAIVVPCKDVDAIAQAMERMADKSLRVTLGRNAASFARERFDSKVLCEKIVERKGRLLNYDTKEDCGC